MNFYFAPMEGLTGHIYRNVHHAFFNNINKYFSPFIVANQSESFKIRELHKNEAKKEVCTNCRCAGFILTYFH